MYEDIHIIMSLTVGVVITAHPQDELVNVSDSVNFTCEASGSLPINYRWLYNGSYIMNDPGHIEGVNTSTLMIVNVNVTDWGMYSCEASNIVDNATSNEATLYGECIYDCVCTVSRTKGGGNFHSSSTKMCMKDLNFWHNMNACMLYS